MPGAANAMMRSAAQGGSSPIAAPRSAETDGINAYLELPWGPLPTSSDWSVIGFIKQLDAQYVGWNTAVGSDGGIKSAGTGLGPTTTSVGFQFRAYNGSVLRRFSGSSNAENRVLTNTWMHWACIQNAAADPRVYRYGVKMTSPSLSNDTANASSVHYAGRVAATSYVRIRLRSIARLPAALIDGQAADLYTLAAANDDAGVRDFLLSLSPLAGYFPVTADSDLTSGSGSIVDVCGNYGPIIPWNMTTVGNLSTDVP
jgi:hypothetical protein